MFQKKVGTIFLKESSKAEQSLEKLKMLSNQTEGDLKEQIETQIKLVEAGIFGENAISFELKNSGRNMYVLRDLYLEYGEYSAQIDFLVITEKHVYCLECKNLIGNIEIDDNGNFIRKLQFGKYYSREGIYSPITQNDRHLLTIRELRASSKGTLTKYFFERNFESTYIPLVVLANPKSYLNMEKAPKEIQDRVIRADQLNSRIKKMDDANKDYAWSNKEMRELAEFFLSNHKENPSDYEKKYEELLLEVREKQQKEQICPRCGAKLVLREAKRGERKGKSFWGCETYPKCRFIRNIDRI